jgi:hypothetical protein
MIDPTKSRPAPMPRRPVAGTAPPITPARTGSWPSHERPGKRRIPTLQSLTSSPRNFLFSLCLQRPSSTTSAQPHKSCLPLRKCTSELAEGTLVTTVR